MPQERLPVRKIKEVIRLHHEAGLSNRAIASKLVIGDETVKTHLSSIYRKLGVNDRTGAVATALREGIYQ